MPVSSAEPAATTPPVESRTFYSKSGHLRCYPKKPTRVIEDGQSKVIDGDPIEFIPNGVAHERGMWGQFTTGDPELIAFLEARSDVVGPGEFNRAITPDSVRVKNLEDDNSKLLREITEKNNLIKRLEQQGRLPAPKSAQG